MSNLLDPDAALQELGVDELRVLVARNSESVLLRGRALMELGRRASSDAGLLQDVAGLIRAPENRQLITVGTISVAQLGAAGLMAGGSGKALALAAELIGGWQLDERADFAWLMRAARPGDAIA